MVDGATLVELLKDKNLAFEAREDLNNAILDEVKNVRRGRRVHDVEALLELLRLQFEHQIEEHGVFKVLQVLHPAEHTEDKLNFLITVAFDRVLLQEFFPFGVLGNHSFVLLGTQASESVVMLRDDGRTARAIKDQGEFTEVVTVLNFVGLEARAAHMVTHLHTATATTLEEVDGWIVIFILNIIHRVVLRDDSILWIFLALAQAHEDRGEEGLVTAIAFIVHH